MERRFTIILSREDKGYSAQCLELPYAISQGDSREEALKNIKEAIELVLETLGEKAIRERGRDVELEEVTITI
ncbi:MAG: type II toxin-antitoxin system HicB family antitoxin [Candidatus Nitrosocaldus sp.]